MSTAALKAAASGTSLAKKEPQTFPQFLQAYLPEIARALPKHLSADRMARIALTEFRKNPKLAECDPKSVFAAVIMLSQLGLEPGVLGQAYLVPYKTNKGMQCQAIPGWKGLVDMVSRTGRATVSAQAAFDGDDFDYEFGTTPFLKHKPLGREPANRADFTHVYAVGHIRGAEKPVFDVWTRERVFKHRDRFNKVGSSHYSFEHSEMYARKVVLLQVLKYLPASPELQTAMELEEAAEKTGQGLDLSNVIDGTWSAVDSVAAEQSSEPRYDVASAIKALREAGDAKGLEEAWLDINADFNATNREIPVAIEAVQKERKEQFTKL